MKICEKKIKEIDVNFYAQSKWQTFLEIAFPE